MALILFLISSRAVSLDKMPLSISHFSIAAMKPLYSSSLGACR